MTRHAVLMISHDIVGPSMAGPGIRCYHLARVLVDYADVTLAIPSTSPGNLNGAPFNIARYNHANWSSLQPLVESADICILPSDIAFLYPQLAEEDAYFVIDGYDPLLAEWLALNSSRDPEDVASDWRNRLVQLLQQYVLGDYFICASERQRDWWIGLLEANGRINPATYRHDPSLRKLVDVVAYGLPEDAPKHTRSVVKGIWNGIAETDKVLLWGGGLWPWLDPITAIRATNFAHEQRQDVRLIFPGTRHPNPALGALPSHNRSARKLAKELGLLDKVVYFGDWIAYNDWQNLLLECDLALTLHHDTLETRLAFRSRVLEYIWAELPIVATTGDATSEIVQRYSLGRVVNYNDEEEVAGAILELLAPPNEGRNAGFANAAKALNWRSVAQPLIAYCQNPWRAADKTQGVYNPGLLSQLQEDRSYWEERVAQVERTYYIRAKKWLDQQRRKAVNRLSPKD